MSTAFLVDKYEITMLQAALESGVAHREATFELFARKLPRGRAYGVVGGVTRAIEAVENFKFTEEQLTFLKEDPLIKPETIEYLRNYKFSGNIVGYPEGDLYFPYSPVLTVTGTFGEAVLLETVLLSILNHDSAVASAAARMVQAAKNKFPLIEMGSRRTHEIAAVASARMAYAVGFAATSNMEAGLTYGVPTTGTSAHAFTLAHLEEKEAFAAQVKALGVSTTLLVDTYDIEQGIRNAVEVAGINLGGIRIDSGDPIEESFKARALLDSLGAVNTKIILSSDIDEFIIDELVKAGAPVDGVGAGTRVVTGSGHSTAGMVFKLVEIADEHGELKPVAKKSTGKKSVGGYKHVFRKLSYTFPEGVTEVAYKDSHLIKATLADEYYSIAPEFADDENAVIVQIPYIEKGVVVNSLTLSEIKNIHKRALAILPEEMLEVVYEGQVFETHIN